MPETTNPQPDRRERYAAAIRETDGWVLDDGQHMIDAVIAVADAEQADLATENAKLIRWHREDGDALAEMRGTIARLRAALGEAAEVAVRAARGCGESEAGQYAASVAAGVGKELRRLADEPAPGPSRVAGEAQQPETQGAPCSQPNPCEDGGDPCTVHEREQAHAEGDHGLCGSECSADRCTCADAGDCFAPSGHYADCPAAEQPAAVSQPGKEASVPGVVAYRDPNSPKTLLCRDHGERWQGVVPVTAEELPDGGICTFGRLSSLECGRDVLITEEPS
jgi:hypothetical protein